MANEQAITLIMALSCGKGLIGYREEANAIGKGNSSQINLNLSLQNLM